MFRTTVLLLLALLLSHGRTAVAQAQPAPGQPITPLDLRIEAVKGLSYAQQVERRWWAQGEAVPIVDVSFRAQLDEGGPSHWSVRSEEEQGDKDAIDTATLTEPQRADLDAALRGLLQAQQTDKPQKVIDYMAGRGEHVSPSRMEIHRKMLKKSLSLEVLAQRGMDLDSLTDADVYIEQSSHPQPRLSHWSGAVPEHFVTRVWSAGPNDAAGVRRGDGTFAALQSSFLGITTWGHNFQAADGQELEDVLAADGSALVADARVLIEHDKALNNQRAVYLVRFWFNPRCGKWQPIAFARVDMLKDKDKLLSLPLF